MEYQGIDLTERLEKEQDSILKFLDKYWDISLSGEKPLPEAIDLILRNGAKYGIAMQEKSQEKAVDYYNGVLDLAKKIHDSDTHEKLGFERTSTNDDLEGYFDGQAGPLESALREEWGLDPKPKGYEEFKSTNPDDYEGCDEVLEFSGSGLHPSIGTSCLEFQRIMNKGNIYYSESSQGRPPLIEFVGAILRQGMNIGIRAVEEKHGDEREIYKESMKILDSLKP